jgi:hypothetical protein
MLTAKESFTVPKDIWLRTNTETCIHKVRAAAPLAILGESDEGKSLHIARTKEFVCLLRDGRGTSTQITVASELLKSFGL